MKDSPYLAETSASAQPAAHAAGYHGDDRWLLLWAALIGVLGALATVAFHEGMAFAESLATGHPGSLVAAAEALAPWRRAITPALGGIVAGAFLWWARRVAKGKKQPDYLEAIAVGDGRQDVRGTLLRSASSLCTIASGGSIGREGAMVQLAAATGSWVGQLGRFEGDQLRLLLACGAAAGFASAYDAALSGAIFIAEVVYGTLVIRRLGPLMVASVTANVTVHQVLGYEPVYKIPPLHVTSLWELPLFLLMGLLLGALAPLFMGVLDGARRLAKRLPLGLPLKLALGGLVVGAISVWRPEVWGNGYSVVNGVLHTPWPLLLVLWVLLAKILATAATVGLGRGRRCVHADHLRRRPARSARGQRRACAVAWLVTAHRLCGDRHGRVSGRHHARAADVLSNSVRDDAGISIGAGPDAGLPHCLSRLPCDPNQFDLLRRPASRHRDRGRRQRGAGSAADLRMG